MENTELKQYEVKIESLETQLKEYELKLSDKDKQLSEASEKIKQFEADKVAAFSKEVDSYLDGAVKEGKLSPAQKETICALCASQESFDKVKEFVAAQGAQIPMGEQSAHQEIDKSDKPEGDMLDEKVKAYAKENNVSYGEAFSAVAREIEIGRAHV